MKKISKLAAFLIIFILSFQAAYAVPTISSPEHQTFDKNQGTEQLRDLVITEDSEETFITAGELKISIPDTLEMIFDASRTEDEILLYGSAVDSGKIEESPTVTFDNGDKTLIIPILADFAPGEEVTVTKVFVEGFHSVPSESAPLSMQINNDSTIYYDTYELFIQNSTREDNHRPDTPTNIAITDHEDGVIVTWDDPTDLDLQTVHVMRGTGSTPVDASNYAEITAGTQEYIDTDVEEGETVKYILRANDGRNYSYNSDEYSFVVGSSTTTDDTTTDDTTDDTTTDDTTTDDTTTDDTTTELPLSDIEGHWAEDMIVFMVDAGIVSGHPDGTFDPEGTLNRAEAAALLQRIIGGEPEIPSEDPFPDVSTDDWFAGYISELLETGIVSGNPDGTFRPSHTVNRAEFLHMAINAMGYVFEQEYTVSTITDAYTDLDTSAWYADTVTIATDLGIVEGSDCDEAKCFNAADEITRAEAVKILYNIFSDRLATE